ncbi:MAG TPA: cache domain-containing protein [Thermoanaerobaculia bacterium]|nr:cache domain-containing protein [Thermoanaerobaculia bacterium]
MSATTARNRPALGAAGISIIILLAAFGIYYFVYAEKQTAYFAHRDLRILGTVADQIKAAFDLRIVFLHQEPTQALQEVTGQTFGQTVLASFDQILLADQNGAVIWSAAGTERISSIDNFVTAGTWQKAEALPIKALLPRGNHSEILLHGDRYHLFTQPLKLSGDPRTYVLAGFVSATKFNRESLGISYTLILAVLAALLLTVFSMPYLKLKLIDRLERVRLSDVLVLGVCTMCIVSVVTIALLDLVTYRRMRAHCDEQLRHLASDINAHIAREVNGALDALVYLDAQLPVTPRANQPIPAAYLASEQLRNYPYLQSFFRIDEKGVLAERWSAPNEPARAIGIDVSTRDYFNDLKLHREWVDATHGQYALSSVHSYSTGEAQAVVARHPVRPSATNKAAGLGIPMLSLINTVVAGDCKYVVIDNDGQVQFHSEWQRNLAENFFDETDHDRALRAAVVGRQNELIDIRYWGSDQRAFVAPIPGTPWTLITFRDKVLLRTINVEMIVITVVFMALYGAVFVLLLASAALVRPSYRAPWLWPTLKRAHDYQRLIYSYALLALAFGVSIYCMRPKQLLTIALLLPLIALLAMFLRLRRVQTWFALGGGFVLLIVGGAWLIATVSSDGSMEPDLFWHPRLMLLISLFAGTAGILAAVLPPFTEHEMKKTLSTPRYIGLGAMLTILLAILPTAAFFKAAYKIEIESFVKYGQLRIAKELDEPAAKRSIGTSGPAENLGVYYDFFFDTDIRSIPPTVVTSSNCGRRFTSRGSPPLHLSEASILPQFMEPVLPQYSDQSVSMRELHHDTSRDDQWKWERCGPDLDLEVNGVHGARTFIVSRLPYLGLRFNFFQPALDQLPYAKTFKPEPHRDAPGIEDDALTIAAGGTVLLFLLLAYAALIYTMIRFLLHHVFLVDVSAPQPLPQGRNLLLLARSRASAREKLKPENFIEVGIAGLDWPRDMTAIDLADAGKAVLIPDFETRSADKLPFVERLLANHGRTVVAITTTSPMTLLDQAAGDPALQERWLALFEQFDYEIEERRLTPREEAVEPREALLPLLRRLAGGVRTRTAMAMCKKSVKERAAIIVSADTINGSAAHASALIARESSGVPFLKLIGDELLARGVRGEEELYDELSERAAEHYAGLWASCSKSEKVVLLNIATDGFANVKDRRVIRRLMARCLVYRDPSLCVMNETFRRFVITRRPECAALMEDSAASAWNKLQKPLAIAVACFAIFFFSTQREMFDVTMGVVTGLAGGIPAFLRIVGMFMDPKTAVKPTSA